MTATDSIFESSKSEAIIRESLCKECVLVIDLDGTLCRTDTLHEALFSVLATKPFYIFPLLRTIREGKTIFKQRVANYFVVPPDTLPFNEDVIGLAKQARADGRRVVLASAAHHRQVDAVAQHLGLFDEAFGTGSQLFGQDAPNLNGAEKANFLVHRYGSKGFDYVGDNQMDLHVWKHARHAITVGAGPKLRRAAEELDPEATHFSPLPSPSARVRAYLRAMRPHQWLKNILLFLPIFAAHDISNLGAVVAGFVAFSLLASSVYILNDLVDLPADRSHPRKRLRPFAAGAIPILHGATLALSLLILACVISLFSTPPIFLAVLAFYYVSTFAYSLWLKRKLIVDVLTLTGLYTVRIIAGAAAAGLMLSPWMLGFSMFLFFALAAVKRQTELTDQLRDGRAKTAGRAYLTEDLPVLRGMALSSGYSAVLVFALYINSDQVTPLYSYPEALWLICPLLLYWISRMVMMTHRGYMTDDPIVYTARDRVSQSVILISIGVFVVAGLA